MAQDVSQAKWRPLPTRLGGYCLAVIAGAPSLLASRGCRSLHSSHRPRWLHIPLRWNHRRVAAAVACHQWSTPGESNGADDEWSVSLANIIDKFQSRETKTFSNRPNLPWLYIQRALSLNSVFKCSCFACGQSLVVSKGLTSLAWPIFPPCNDPVDSCLQHPPI